MKYKGIEITPVKRPNEPYCNSCGDSGERWKVRVSLGDVGGTTVVLCTDCLQALAKMSLGIQSLYAQDGRHTDDTAKHGHYIVDSHGNLSCSVCGAVHLDCTHNYCPHCGARMDEPIHCEQIKQIIRAGLVQTD